MGRDTASGVSVRPLSGVLPACQTTRLRSRCPVSLCVFSDCVFPHSISLTKLNMLAIAGR